MEVNIYLPHFSQKSKNKFFLVEKSKLSGSVYEKEMDSVHKVVIAFVLMGGEAIVKH